MKSIVFLAAALATSMISTAHANGLTQFECNSGNGALQLTISANQTQSIEVLIINASGVEDGSGTLACTGPQQSAYNCSGKIKLQSLNAGQEEFVNLQLTVSEYLFAGYGTPVTSGNSTYYCRLVR